MIRRFFQRDNMWFGMVLAIITPVIVYYALYYFIEFLSLKINYGITLVSAIDIQMTAIFLNLFIYFKYLLSSRYELTGRGILVITFVLAIIHFIIRYTLM